MQIKEEKICSFTQKGKRIQLLKVTEKNKFGMEKTIEKYHVRVNRRIVDNTISEAIARRRFAGLITIAVLQQKFTF